MDYGRTRLVRRHGAVDHGFSLGIGPREGSMKRVSLLLMVGVLVALAAPALADPGTGDEVEVIVGDCEDGTTIVRAHNTTDVEHTAADDHTAADHDRSSADGWRRRGFDDHGWPVGWRHLGHEVVIGPVGARLHWTARRRPMADRRDDRVPRR